MRSKYQIYLFAFILILTAIGIMSYKINVLGFPLFAGEEKSVWNIEAKVKFKGTGENAFISLALPDEQEGMSVYNPNASSPNYGFTTAQSEGYIRGEWAKRKVRGSQTLYYSIDVIIDEYFSPDYPKVYKKQYQIEASSIVIQASTAIMKDAYKHSSDDISMTARVISAFNKNETSQAVKMLNRKYIKNEKDLRDVIASLLEDKKVTLRRIGALKLVNGQRNVKLKPMLEVYEKGKWQLFDLKKGKVDKSEQLFIWQRGAVSLLDAEGVRDSRVSFSITQNVVSSRSAALLKGDEGQISLIDYSLFILPNESQNAFKHLLLIPIGALVVVLLRIFIGIKTSGTFMPILLALAFIQTELMPGITMFILVVSIGLVVRSYLSALNLLLVARISAVVIVVVGIMAMVAILSYKLGVKDAVNITFFPMIILAWTIERMSIIWEEDGAQEVLTEGGGSLLVAIVAYFAMTNSIMQFWTFNFPEFLLAVLGVIILIGRYSGYRLSELYRFAYMLKKDEK
ncbi:MAG: gonadoliberin III [Arcobacter sp.]|nr:MAG: gonadoliberin III [Arcobacter sp.]